MSIGFQEAFEREKDKFELAMKNYFYILFSLRQMLAPDMLFSTNLQSSTVGIAKELSMDPSDIQAMSSALAAHPPVVIGALIIFQCIKRGMSRSWSATN